MLTNDHYIGMVHWNKRKTVKVVEDGEVVATRPRNSDFLVYPGKHQPIIEKELWDAVQAIKGNIPPIKNRAKYANPFAGLVVCRCGGKMVRQQYIRDGVERCAPRLVCPNQAECHTASCSLPEFTEAVIEALEKGIKNFELMMADAPEDDATQQERLIAQLEKRLAELDRLELAQWDKYTQEAMPKHVFDALNKKVVQEKEETLQALKTAMETVPIRVDYEKKRETFAAAVRTLQDPDASVKEKNLLLKQCIERINYNRKPKESDNRRFGNPEPLELEFQFKV